MLLLLVSPQSKADVAAEWQLTLLFADRQLDPEAGAVSWL